eukprot:m.570416 g.570416  ORF g.570416 m.570416 type:complete len:546 (+) comp22263_c3_seq20:196-1833(+)
MFSFVSVFPLVVVVAVHAAAPRPNFIVFFADDMGYSQPSALSDKSPFAGDNGTIRTPNLDKLGAEGVVFTSWYSAFHVCSPSRAAMLTGRLPVRSGIGYVGDGSNGVFTDISMGGLPLNETTVATSLRRAGYTTGMVGKYHLGVRDEFLPTNHGFDSYYGIPFSCDMGISAFNYRNHSSPPFQARPLPLLANLTILEQPVNLATLTARYTKAVLDFVSAASAKAAPFYLYVAFNHVHAPNFRSEKFCGSSARGPVGDAAQEMDAAIGEIMTGVSALGLDESVVYFFSSDNGAPLSNDGHGNGPLRDGKTTTWEGGIRVPGAVRWKGTLVPRISDVVVTTYDIFPTIHAMAGVTLPDVTIDGKDLTPVLMNSSTESQHDCVFHYHSSQDRSGTSGPNGLAAVRCGNYKAHFFTKSTTRGAPVPDGLHDPPILFNLVLDVGETHPIDNTSSLYRTTMAGIKAAVKTHLASVDVVPCQMHAADKCHIDTLASVCVGGNNMSVAICKDINSKAKFPDWPVCTSDPEYYGSTSCREQNQDCIAKCMPHTL